MMDKDKKGTDEHRETGYRKCERLEAYLPRKGRLGRSDKRRQCKTEAVTGASVMIHHRTRSLEALSRRDGAETRRFLFFFC